MTPLTAFRHLSKLEGLVFEKFGHIDRRLSNIRQGYAIHMDYDNPSTPPTIPALYSVLRVLGIGVSSVCYSCTRRGWHVTASLIERLNKPELVALQSILGSDPMREALNLMRCIQMRLHRKALPIFWQQRWNILYDHKVT